MSFREPYADGYSGNRKKALTGGIVALIQGGLAVALVNGFAVNLFAPEPPKHLPSNLYPTAPMQPQPTETPKVLPEKPVQMETPVRAPEARLPIVPDTALTVLPIGPVQPTGGAIDKGESFIITPVPSDPPARFAPKTAKPRGNVAGWVTTEDYPTTDIRAGHTGTVRFRLAIDGAGRVTGCTITQSSGYTGLDAATCRNVAKRARFDAASDAMGDKVAGTYDGTIRWVIPQD